MRVLLVAATDPEIAPLLDQLQPTSASTARTRTCRYREHDVDLLTTGVGMVATAVWVTRALAQVQYDFALNVGVCGAFDPALPPGTVVHVAADRIAELGAEDDERFVTIHDLDLVGEDEFPFRGGLIHAAPRRNPALSRLPTATGITVNTVHGRAASIAAVEARFQPQVESMEGAAFMYACMTAPVPFAQVRAVSNVVEKRNRAAWRMPEAIENLAAAAVEILDNL